MKGKGIEEGEGGIITFFGGLSILFLFRPKFCLFPVFDVSNVYIEREPPTHTHIHIHTYLNLFGSFHEESSTFTEGGKNSEKIF